MGARHKSGFTKASPSRRRTFSFIILPMDFKTKVYNAVKKIPKGSVWTYKDVAKKIGHPLAFRAVGNVLNKNIDPKVPCHRVIRSDGKIGGYRDGSEFKRKRLREEGYLK